VNRVCDGPVTRAAPDRTQSAHVPRRIEDAQLQSCEAALGCCEMRYFVIRKVK
jgi:hypothetical protein